MFQKVSVIRLSGSESESFASDFTCLVMLVSDYKEFCLYTELLYITDDVGEYQRKVQTGVLVKEFTLSVDLQKVFTAFMSIYQYGYGLGDYSMGEALHEGHAFDSNVRFALRLLGGIEVLDRFFHQLQEATEVAKTTSVP